MKFCCASNAAIKNVKIVRKKSTFFFPVMYKSFIGQKYFKQNRHFSKKYRFLEKIRYIFGFWRFSSFWLVIYLFRSNSEAMNQHLQQHVEFTKNYENHVNFKF